MVVDSDRVVLRLKEELFVALDSRGKRSWGQRELLDLIGRLEVECQIPEALEDFDGRPPRGVDKPALEPAAVAAGS